MTMTLIDSTGLSANTQKNDTLEVKFEAFNPTEGPSFGQYLSDMFQLQADKMPDQAVAGDAAIAASPGQEIADSFGLGQTATLPASHWPLQAVTLGPHLNVITPTSSAPDAQSLEAFARAQGLDEKAVHWLFGSNTLPSTNAADASTSDQSPNPLNLTTLGLSTSGSSSNLPPSHTGSAYAASAIAPSGAPSGPAPVHTLTAPVPPLTATVLQPPANDPSKDLLSNAMVGVQALWAMTEGSSDAKKPIAPNPTSTEDGLPLQMLRMPTPAAVWMQRTALNPARTDLITSSTAAAISLSELDLGSEWGGDVLQQLLASDGSANAGASATGTHGTAYANFAARWDAQAASRADLAAANTPATELPDAASRSENIQNLADKMGQAVGQRILSEMERGQWHLKLSLRPATLGHIEVEMRMRSGELDAVFTAPNAVTRDLLQDGMGKLRETLGQMGMDVANIHVGDGQTGQSGGDSTPGSFRGPPASKEAGAAETNPEATRAPSVKDPADGLDVLV